jgi:hypothetical protein
MTNIAQAVRILSGGKITVGPEGTISEEDLDVLLGLLQPEIDRMNPGFTGNELLLFTGYYCLDALETRNGAQVVEKQVKDTHWKVARPTSSSTWMDKAQLMIKKFTYNSFVPSGVARCDSTVKGFDNT